MKVRGTRDEAGNLKKFEDWPLALQEHYWGVRTGIVREWTAHMLVEGGRQMLRVVSPHWWTEILGLYLYSPNGWKN